MQIAWKVKRNNKLASAIVGHMPREISSFTKLFLIYSGRIEAKIFSAQGKPSLIPSGGLEIPLLLSF